jgi:hypothetical protein
MKHLPHNVLNHLITTIEGEILPLYQLIKLTTSIPVTHTHHIFINNHLNRFCFTTEEKTYTLINSSNGSFFV